MATIGNLACLSGIPDLQSRHHRLYVAKRFRAHNGLENERLRKGAISQ